MCGKIYSNIKTIRELKGYTQECMALKLSITQAGYSRIESGAGGMSFEKLEEIAAIFEMELPAVINFQGSFLLQAALGRPAAESHGPSLQEIGVLYRDKIALLEKLLLMTELELERCREKL
jgi:transcriptional regulator with XRE-family HTH domain